MDSTTLRKILEIEKKGGYGDSAVFGGLDRYLDRVTGGLPAGLCRFNYADMNIAQRGAWVGEVLEWLDANRGGSAINGRKTASKPPTFVRKRRSVAKVVREAEGLDSPITSLKGVSDKLAARFGRLGVRTVRDMLYFFPRRHIDYSQRKAIAELEPGEEQTVIATVWQSSEVNLGGRRSAEVVVGDGSGNMRVVWFNQPYLAKQLRANSKFVFSGRVSLFKGVKVFVAPEYEPLSGEDLTHTGRLIPVYRLTEGLSSRTARRIVKEAVERWASQLDDFLPEDVRRSAGLIDLAEAVAQAHYPRDYGAKDGARRRLAFDELFIIQLGVLSRRKDWREGGEAGCIEVAGGILQAFFDALPFEMTGAQMRSLDEILADIAGPKPMSRLLQGDVGSGKTAVATAALLSAVAGGYQGAFMAPTELLAEQHFDNISNILGVAGRLERDGGSLRAYASILERPVAIALLKGGMKKREREAVYAGIASGDVDIAVGTHALIQGEVEFARLGLAVVDEQHRFGVMQRSALRRKGLNPHLLAMTATPIPRSLALTLYGDLDLSLIDELPKGRQEIRTKWLSSEERDRAYNFIRKQAGEGRQAFIICPLIEESEAVEARAAVSEYERLANEVFPDLRLGLVHGRLKPTDKDDAMRRFREGEYDILVATPVVEVGIDIPNATVMLIEGAERFGLAQLHQFRGRVGRGLHRSYCILLSDSSSPDSGERLSLMERLHDGFKLAEEDLRLRGPGDFFGTRQSGIPDLKMARLSDTGLLDVSRGEATGLFKRDSMLSRPEHRLLKAEVARVWGDGVNMGEA